MPVPINPSIIRGLAFNLITLNRESFNLILR